MIVPRNRLLLWVGLLMLPFATVAVAVPDAAAAAWALVALFGIVVLLDAERAFRALDGIRAAGPDVVRFSKGREGDVALAVRNETGKARRVRLGLALPPEFIAEREDLLAVLPGGAVESLVPFACTPFKRGRYFLEHVYLEASSPLGFWGFRDKLPASTELRVYPNLREERRNLAALFLNRGGFGIHAQRQVGKGREFEKLREYVPGDSFEDIHWKATAKRGHPITKTYQIERTQEVYVIIDASRLSARTVPGQMGEHGTPQTELERFITAALVMGLAAERQGDLFGTLIFNDKVQQFVRAKNGKAHYSACRDALYTLQPTRVNPDFDELCSFIRLRMRRRALLVFLTNLDDPVLAESFTRNMELLRRHHLVLVNMMRPAGAQPLFAEADTHSTEDVYQRLAGHLQWHDLRELERALHRRGVTFSLVDNERLCMQLVAQYLNVKQRQLL